MKTFKWCAELWVSQCTVIFPQAHSHIMIRSPGASPKTPKCNGIALHLDFQDLEPGKIQITKAFEKDPQKGKELIDQCFKADHAYKIADFVKSRPDDELIIVNCEGGVSRSPGVVLALRRHFGGDEQDIFANAFPNMHVANALYAALQGWKRNYYSGVCLCGHSWERHHLSMVGRIEFIALTNEGTIPGECLAYGSNERGGLDEHGEPHCFGYIDRDHPDPAERARWGGTKR